MTISDHCQNARIESGVTAGPKTHPDAQSICAFVQDCYHSSGAVFLHKFAHIGGVSERLMTMYMQGRRIPDYTTLMRMAEAGGLDVGELDPRLNRVRDILPRLRELRAISGTSQVSLSKILRCDPRKIVALERGYEKARFTITQVLALVDWAESPPRAEGLSPTEGLPQAEDAEADRDGGQIYKPSAGAVAYNIFFDAMKMSPKEFGARFVEKGLLRTAPGDLMQFEVDLRVRPPVFRWIYVGGDAPRHVAGEWAYVGGKFVRRDLSGGDAV